MKHPKDTNPDPLKPTSATNQPREQRGPFKPVEGQANTSDVRPGVPQRDAQGRPTGNQDKTDPNPGPGITDQGHRADNPKPRRADEHGNERSLPDEKNDKGTRDDRRDQDRDREHPVKAPKVGDEPPEQTTRAKD